MPQITPPVVNHNNNNRNFCTINEHHPTRIVHNCRSSPDLSIVAASIWQADIALNSDHFPIILEVAKDSDFFFSEKKTFVNCRQTDWDCFKALSESMFEVWRVLA